jgi:hypothetical protein
VSFGLLPTISQHRLVPHRVSFIERTSPPGHTLLSGRLALFLLLWVISLNENVEKKNQKAAMIAQSYFKKYGMILI